MAKTKQTKHDDWVVLSLILLVLATNLYWMLAVRDLNKRLDSQTEDIQTLSSELAEFKQTH